MNNKKGTGSTNKNYTINKCPKCSSIVSMDSFEPTCVICGWVDYAYSESKRKKNKLKVNLRKLNKAS